MAGQLVQSGSTGVYSFSADQFTEIHKGVMGILQTNRYKDYSGWVFLDIQYDENGRISRTSAHLYQPNDEFERDLLNMLDRLPVPGSLIINGKKVPYERFCVVLVEGDQIAIPEELLAAQRRVIPLR